MTNYTPGLKVTSCIRHRVRRVLPIAGEVLVQTGERVAARDVVAQTFMPGNATPLNLANALSLPPSDVPECMLKNAGEAVEQGEPLARTKGIFGWFKSEYKSPATGTIETVSDVTGQVIVRGESIPVQVRAYVAGEVVEVIPDAGVVIEADVAFVQGIFGIGGETFGPIRLACVSHTEELTADQITPEMKDSIVVGGARMTHAAIRRGIEVGAAAIVSGGIDDQDLRTVLGYDLGVAVTGSESVGITLVVTEGFGEIAMAAATHRLLASHEGDEAAVNGATQIRAGVLRPEIVIPLGQPEIQERGASAGGGAPPADLQSGSQVRIIREPHFGVLGTVAELPGEPQSLESGSKARVVKIDCESGDSVIVPRANVEVVLGR